MNSADLIAIVRRNTTTEDTAGDYADAVILSELNDSLLAKFSPSVTGFSANYWHQLIDYTLSAGQAGVRIPPRALYLSKCEIGTGSGTATDFQRLALMQEGHVDIYQQPLNQLGSPVRAVARGDRLELQPPADNTGYTLRIRYFIEPSKLYPPQNSDPVTGGTDRGRITAINTSTRIVTVNALPFDQSLAVPAAITSAQQLVDIVHPDGWHELPMVGQSQTISGFNITLGGSDDMSEVQVGDYVRVIKQTDWPCLPDSFHRCLADIASIKILMQQRDANKAGMFAADVTADLERFAQTVSKRAEEETIVLRADLPSLRRRW